MAAEKGFIKISRALDEWEHADSLPMVGFWVRLLLLANWEDKKKVKRGEIVTTIPILASTCGCSEKTIQRYLDKLRRSGEIVTSTNHRKTKIRIVKYDLYQSGKFDQTADQTADQTYQYKRSKEVKKRRKEESSSPENFTPPTADEVREYAESEQLQLDIERFLHFNEKKGWIDHDWKYLVRSWCKKDEEFQKARPKKKDELPDWYNSDPNRSVGGEKMSDEEMEEAKKILQGRGKRKEK